METVFKILKNTFDMEYEKEKRNSSVNEKYMEWKTIFYSLTIGERKDQLFGIMPEKLFKSLHPSYCTSNCLYD